VLPALNAFLALQVYDKLTAGKPRGKTENE
jgi:hypothetical protein